MGTDAEQWRETVEPHFGFIAGFGYDAVDLGEESSPWSAWVQYRSATSAVRVSRSTEFLRSEVHLIRLVDGGVPPYPIWLTEDRIDWVLLDNVVSVRRPDLEAEVTRQSGLRPAQVDEQLAFWANLLRDVAGDFLHGSFDPLDEAGALIRGRVAEHPEQVHVWIPSDAAEEAEAQQLDATRATLPPGVGVSVRRYLRRPRRGRTD